MAAGPSIAISEPELIRPETTLMPEIIELSPSSRWVELRTTKEDWKKADPKLLGTLLAHLHLIRAFEETVVELAMEGLVHGPAHSSIGQEGGAAGCIVSLTTRTEAHTPELTSLMR